MKVLEQRQLFWPWLKWCIALFYRGKYSQEFSYGRLSYFYFLFCGSCFHLQKMRTRHDPQTFACNWLLFIERLFSEELCGRRWRDVIFSFVCCLFTRGSALPFMQPHVERLFLWSCVWIRQDRRKGTRAHFPWNSMFAWTSHRN